MSGRCCPLCRPLPPAAGADRDAIYTGRLARRAAGGRGARHPAGHDPLALGAVPRLLSAGQFSAGAAGRDAGPQAERCRPQLGSGARLSQLEVTVLDWLVRMLDLSGHFLPQSDSSGGGIAGSATEGVLLIATTSIAHMAAS